MNKLDGAIVSIHNKHRKKYNKALKDYNKMMINYEASKKNGGGVPEPKKPTQKKLISDKITPEKLYKNLEENKNGILIWRDELKSLFIKNDERSELLRTDLISGWSSQRIIHETKTQGEVFVEGVPIRLGGNVQREVIKKILADNRGGMAADGFIVRFQLIALMYKTSYKWEDPEILPFNKSKFEDAMKKIYKKASKLKKSALLTFDDEAKELLKQTVEPLDASIEDLDTSYAKEYISKAKSLLGSLVAILHVLEYDVSDKINAETLRKAINITNTAIDIAFDVFGMAKREKAIEEVGTEKLEQWLKNTTLFDKHKKDGLTAKTISDTLNKKTSTTIIRKFFEERNGYKVKDIGRGCRIFKAL
jgi:hypothetical protein